MAVAWRLAVCMADYDTHVKKTMIGITMNQKLVYLLQQTCILDVGSANTLVEGVHSRLCYCEYSFVVLLYLAIPFFREARFVFYFHEYLTEMSAGKKYCTADYCQRNLQKTSN